MNRRIVELDETEWNLEKANDRTYAVVDADGAPLAIEEEPQEVAAGVVGGDAAAVAEAREEARDEVVPLRHHRQRSQEPAVAHLPPTANHPAATRHAADHACIECTGVIFVFVFVFFQIFFQIFPKVCSADPKEPVDHAEAMMQAPAERHATRERKVR